MPWCRGAVFSGMQRAPNLAAEAISEKRSDRRSGQVQACIPASVLHRHCGRRQCLPRGLRQGHRRHSVYAISGRAARKDKGWHLPSRWSGSGRNSPAQKFCRAQPAYRQARSPLPRRVPRIARSSPRKIPGIHPLRVASKSRRKSSTHRPTSRWLATWACDRFTKTGINP